MIIASDEDSHKNQHDVMNAHSNKKDAFETIFPNRFINRESSLLAFQKRVLEQAKNPAIPVLERLRFICIVSSNLDEFFEVRVAGIKEQIFEGTSHIDGIQIHHWFENLNREVREILKEKITVFEDILAILSSEGILLKNKSNWTTAEHTWLECFFTANVLPLLTPIALDVAHPFPHVQNKGLNFIINLEATDIFDHAISVAILPIPPKLTRVITIPEHISGNNSSFVFLRDLIHAFMDKIFIDINIKGIYQFRVTRNSNLFIDDEESKNLRALLQGELEQRNFGKAVRLEVSNECPNALIDFLKQQFKLKEIDVYRIKGTLNLSRLMQLPDLVDRPDLKFPKFVPHNPTLFSKNTNIFERISLQDILLHHPFQSFNPVLELLQAAATDPCVFAIRMTVYRTGTDSTLMQELVKAAKNGKEVNVVVELMARFDEATNLSWAEQLEEAGVKVVYGIFGLKTHAKMLLIVRKEVDLQNHSSIGYLKFYSHVGTGNYHPRTAKMYTDFGLLTANQEIGADIAALFMNLSSLGKPPKLKHIWQAPFSLHSNLMEQIEFEITQAQSKRPAYLIAKMNSLLEHSLIDALYRASSAGVKIDLIVRGACSLRPGVKGLSDNIRVVSIVGRFLEHTRVFYFHHAGDENVYISSADWMSRNIFKRIEIAIPILDPKIKYRIIKEGLKNYLADNQNSFELNGNDATYSRHKKRGRSHSAQLFLMR